MLYGAVLKKIRRQIESLIRDQLDATTSSLQRIPNEPSFVVSCPSGCEKLSYKRSEKHSVRPTCKIRDTVQKGAVRHDWMKIHVVDDARFTGRTTYTREGHIDRRTCVGPGPSNIYDAYKAARSASSNRDGGVTDHVPNDDHDATTRSCDKNGAGTGFASVKRKL